MIDSLLTSAEQNYRQAKDVLATGRRPEAIVLFHAGLEALLRWALIRDGADPARATDPNVVTWNDLIAYLDARHGVAREACVFLGQMTALRDQLLAGATPPIQDLHMQAYAQLVAQLYRRFFPRDESERAAMAQRATFGRRQPVDALTSMPPERARDTRVVVPEQPALTGEPSEPPAAAPGAASAEERAADLPADEAETAADTDAANWGPVTAVRPDSAEEQRRRALEAGRRLQELRSRGLDYCPQCRREIPRAPGPCPYCGYEAPPARRAPRAPEPRSALDRLLTLRRQRR
jgi:hypothetical protein